MSRHHVAAAGLMIALSLFAAHPAGAQEGKKEMSPKEKKVRHFLALNGAEAQAKQQFEMMIEQFDMMPGLPPGFGKKFQQMTSPQDLVDMIVPIYMEKVEDSTLDAMIAFYESEEGKKLSAAMPEILKRSTEAGQKWGMEMAMKVSMALQGGGGDDGDDGDDAGSGLTDEGEETAGPSKRDRISAIAALKQIVSTESTMRQCDGDGNGVQDYWTKDVAGFYAIVDASGAPLKFIDIQFAKADQKGMAEYKVLGGAGKAAPRWGYWFRAMVNDDTDGAYAKDEDKDGKAWTAPYMFGFCAYPAKYVKGAKTFITNEEGVIYEKDLGPDATEGATDWPGRDPTTSGWSVVQ